MFKIFKKERIKEAVFNKENIISDLPAIASKLYPKEVLEIHHEFETAADKLLVQAKGIIKEAESKDAVKVSRLESLGFKQTAQVIELKPLLQQAVLSKEQVELLSYYQQNYPLNKFITEDQVKIICHKYNLVCGEVSRFKGFVPEKNLKQIESFKLKDNDKGLLLSNGLFLENAIVKMSNYGNYWHIFKNKGEKYAFQSNDGERFYANDEHDIFSLRDKGNMNFNILNKTLQICAPVKDMDISGFELVDGYKLQKKHIPDPVVLQPVKGGYLILTAWGDEQYDPLIFNEIQN